MKIVTRKELMEKPPGTIFSNYVPSVFSRLMIKGETWGNDFTYADLLDQPKGANAKDETGHFVDYGELCDRMEKEDVPLEFDVYGREGLFDDSMLYAVWSDEDVNGLVTALVNRSKS